MKREAMKTEAAKEIQNNALEVLKARANDATTEFNEAKSQYQNDAAKSGEKS